MLVAALTSGCGSSRWVGEHAGGVVVSTERDLYYVVEQGDTLYSIAFSVGVDYRQLARRNNIRPPYRIYPGQKLGLSKAAPAVVSRPKPSPPTNKHKKSANKSKSPAPRAVTRPGTGVAGGKKLLWQWPTEGRIERSYSRSDPGRKGVDIGGKAGQPIRAAAAGSVVYSGSGLRGYGKLIIVKHNNTYLSAYGHNRKLMVGEGEKVDVGQQIAEMGATDTDHPMLHFEIRRDGEPVNPQRILPKR